MSSAGKRQRRNFWAELAEPSTVISFLILYCAIHFLIRYLLSPNYTLSESEQILFGQSLEWGYGLGHQPLLTSLTWATLTTTQYSRAAFFLLKYAIMAGGLVVYFAAARIVIRDVRMAALATFGLLTTFVMGWLSLVELTNAVLLASMLAAFLWVGARIITRGSPREYLLLAAIMGLGILSEYTFLILPLAYGIAVALTPRLRARIKTGPLILAIILATAIVAPYAWWSYTHEFSRLALTEIQKQGARFSLLNRVIDAADLILVSIGFVLPLIVVFPVLYWPACKKLPISGDEERDWLRLYEITVIAGVVITLGAVLIVDTEAFNPRWMLPAAMPLPVYLFLRARIAGIEERASKIFAGIALALVLIVVVARVSIYETHVKSCRECSEYWPMRSYAEAFRRVGFTRGTILAATNGLGGNLRAVFPDSRVVTPGHPVQVFGPPVSGPCLLVWEGERAPPKNLTDYLVRNYGATADQSSVRGDVNALLLTSETRRDTMNYMLMQKGRCSGT